MEVATDALEFLDLKFKFYKESKQTSMDMFAKDANSFTYVLPSTSFPKNNIETFLKVLLCVLEGFSILMKYLKSVVRISKLSNY